MTYSKEDIKKIIDFDKNGCGASCSDCYFNNVCDDLHFAKMHMEAKRILLNEIMKIL
jgi:hypothetical protein